MSPIRRRWALTVAAFAAVAIGGFTPRTALTATTAWVHTDMDDYPPGATVYITGGGFLANETVQLQVLHVGWVDGEHVQDPAPDTWTVDTWMVQADDNGNLVDATWYVCLDGCANALLEMTATGLTSGLTATTPFSDLAFALYENAGRSIKRDAFAWSSTVFARISQARNDTCYRVEWIDPSASVVATHDLPGTSGLNGNADRDDSFVVPSAGPSGVWTAKEYNFPNGNFACSGSPTLDATTRFDVARAVIIGAGTTGADSVGGDNDVYQDQATVVQNSGTGAAVNVDSSPSKNRRTFVRFDLTGSPISGTVTNAKLRLLMGTSPNNSRTHNAHRVTASWAENTITWNTQPAVAASPTDSQSTGTTNLTLLRWTVTPDVNGFVNGSPTNFGWRISDSIEDASGGNKAAYESTEANTSGDKTQGPVLLVDYHVCGNGTVEPGEDCDQGAANGTAGSCCSATCTFRPNTFECRASAGPCDVAETCTGTSGPCPADGFASPSTSCTGSSQGGACDNDAGDHCSGSGNTCVDAYKTTTCRPSAGPCDVAESCTGTSGACPDDGFASPSTSCTGSSQGGACDNDAGDHCSGDRKS